jgi:hypothetical protein
VQIDVHTDSIEEGHHPKRLQGVPCVCFAAPLITQIPDQPFFPRLPIGVIGQRPGREQSCLTAGTKEEIRADFPWTENKPLDVHEAIRTRAAEEIGNGKNSALDIQLCRGLPPPAPEAGAGVLVDLERRQMKPEILNTRDGLSIAVRCSGS